MAEIGGWDSDVLAWAFEGYVDRLRQCGVNVSKLANFTAVHPDGTVDIRFVVPHGDEDPNGAMRRAPSPDWRESRASS
jgi:hypothetical protein